MWPHKKADGHSDLGGGAASVVTLLDELLASQRRLHTPVAEFASQHDRAPDYLKQWQRLIPLTKPQADEQYAFEVNLDACTGCKACVVACHSLNGLDESESWRDTGAIGVQTVTTACHHCADPACANGCPTLAYEKDAVTGVVRHLDDQCIGCSYCTMKCPYDVPKYNDRLGIVRKCDMCQGRLAEGEAPACVQSCPNGAITIRKVKREGIPSAGSMLPGAWESSYTRPATRYVTIKPAASSVTPSPLREEHSHPPLAAMLVLTQMAAGAFLFAALANDIYLGAFAASILFAGLGASILHLGQPLKAWKAFLGWRKSWLSREIIAFNATAAAATGVLVSLFIPALRPLAPVLLWLSAVFGAGAVFTSIMVYVDTRRPFWALPVTAVKFAGTALLLGAGSAAVMWSWTAHPAANPAALITWSLLLFVSAWELQSLRRAGRDAASPWHRSALIMQQLQPRLLRARLVLLVATGVVLPVSALLFPGAAPVILTAALLATAASQFIERHQFFTAAAAPAMPGCSTS